MSCFSGLFFVIYCSGTVATNSAALFCHSHLTFLSHVTVNCESQFVSQYPIILSWKTILSPCVLLFYSRCLVSVFFNLIPPSLFGAARSLHAGWDVWQLPPSGPWGPRAPLHPHQPLQHSQADHHPVSITMDDHHVWGKGHPAGDGDRPETGLTNLGSGGGLTCCRNK